MKRACCLGGVFLSAAISIANAQALPPAEPQLKVRSFPDYTGKPMNPHCAEIFKMGPKFAPLVNACEYALSPESLPNLVCQETVERSVGGNPLDVVTEEVTFLDGGDQYSNYAINGKPVSSLDGTGGWNSDALFGTLLNAVFFPATSTKFSLPDKPAARDFREFTFEYIRNLSPGFHFHGSDPGVSGSIWINRSTGQLARIESKATRIDPTKPLKSYHSAIDYHNVPISDLGNVLLPTKAAVQVCNNTGCMRNVVSFHDCRKFAATVRILPNP
jgi:hypothetical protein